MRQPGGGGASQVGFEAIAAAFVVNVAAVAAEAGVVAAAGASAGAILNASSWVHISVTSASSVGVMAL